MHPSRQADFIVCVSAAAAAPKVQKTHSEFIPLQQTQTHQTVDSTFFQFNLKSLLLQEVHMRSAERVKKVRFCLIKGPESSVLY